MSNFTFCSLQSSRYPVRNTSRRGACCDLKQLPKFACYKFQLFTRADSLLQLTDTSQAVYYIATCSSFCTCRRNRRLLVLLCFLNCILCCQKRASRSSNTINSRLHDMHVTWRHVCTSSYKITDCLDRSQLRCRGLSQVMVNSAKTLLIHHLQGNAISDAFRRLLLSWPCLWLSPMQCSCTHTPTGMTGCNGSLHCKSPSS